MSARGIGAFIQGAYGGYEFGESVRDRRRQRTRQEELDRIAEEQRAIDNQRIAEVHSWNGRDQADQVRERERIEAERARRQEIYRDGYDTARAATDAEQADAAPATEPPITAADGAATVQGGVAQDDLTPADVADAAMVDAIRQRVEPRLTPEQQAAISANAPANANPPSAGAVPAREQQAATRRPFMGGVDDLRGPAGGPVPVRRPEPRGAMRADMVNQPDPNRYTSRFPDGAAPSPGARGVRRPEADIRQAFDRSFDPRGPAGAPPSTVRDIRSGRPEPLVPTDITPPPARSSQPSARRVEPLLSAERRNVVTSMNPANPNPPSAGNVVRSPPPVRGAMRTYGPEPLVPTDGIRPPPRDAAQTPATAAAAVPAILDATGDPAGQVLSDVIRDNVVGRPPTPAAPDASPAKQREADTEARRFDQRTSDAFFENYREIAVPQIREQLLREGLIEEATAFQTWVDTETTREGVRLYGMAAAAAARGDADAFAEYVVQMYDNNDYFGNGLTVDQENSQFFRDPETGDVYGAQVAFTNEAGETFVETYEGMTEMFEDILTLTAPQEAWELEKARMEARPDRAQAAADAAKAESDQYREDVAAALKTLQEANAGMQQWMDLTPEQQIQQAIAQVDAIRAATAQRGPAPAGQGPVVPVPDWRG